MRIPPDNLCKNGGAGAYPSPVSAQQAWICHCTVFFMDVRPSASEISDEVMAFFRSCLFAYTNKIAWLRC